MRQKFLGHKMSTQTSYWGKFKVKSSSFYKKLRGVVMEQLSGDNDTTGFS